MVKIAQRSERGHGCKFKLETYQTVTAFKASTPIKYGPNPKAKGSKSFDRYAKYMKATTVGEALLLGAKVADLFWEFERGIYTVSRKAGATPARTRRMTPEQLKVVTAKLATLHESRGPRGLATKLDDKEAAKDLAREEAWQRSKVELCRKVAGQLGVQLEEETRQDLLEDGIYETSDTRNCRNVANALAECRLKEREKTRQKVTDQDATEVLRLWGFTQNYGRLNVLPGGRKWVYSDTLGGIKQRAGGYDVTPPTVRYPCVARLLNRWLLDNRPAGLVSDFSCTSININANYGARTHRDGNNVGPSAIRAFGDFTGGELFYWRADNKKTPADELSEADADKLNIKKKTEIFDGNLAHAVAGFAGERISVVFFSMRNYGRVSKPKVDLLKKKCGFNWPTEDKLTVLKRFLKKK